MKTLIMVAGLAAAALPTPSFTMEGFFAPEMAVISPEQTQPTESDVTVSAADYAEMAAAQGSEVTAVLFSSDGSNPLARNPSGQWVSANYALMALLARFQWNYYNHLLSIHRNFR